MRNTHRNVDMVEIANSRVISLFESIMSEGLMGAIGGGLLGAAAGAGGAALAGEKNIKGIGAIGDAMKKTNKVAELGSEAAQLANDTKKLEIAAGMDPTGVHSTITHDPTPILDDFGAATYADNGSVKLEPGKTETITNNDALAQSKKATEKATAAFKDAQSKLTTTDKALNWVGNNHIAAGAAAGGIAGATIGAFAHNDDDKRRAEESDDEFFEDDDKLF